MPTKTISGTLVRSRTPGQRGGVTNTITDRGRTQSFTWVNYEDFHVHGTEAYQNVTATVEIDMSNAKQIEPTGHSHG